MSVDHHRLLTMLVCGAAAPIVALTVSATSSADPEAPVPGPSPAFPVVNQAAPVPALPGPPAAPVPLAASADPSNPTAAPAVVAAPEGVPHLASPDSLPPGSTMDPGAMGSENPNVSYARDLWQAVQNHQISGKQALLLGLAQRGMNSPIPAQAPGPNVPMTPGDPALAPALGPTVPAAPQAPGPGLPLGVAPGPGPVVATAPTP